MAAANATIELQVLIVDDDQLVRNFAVNTIEYGINRKVATFGSGFQAWQFIQKRPDEVDIVIADANIPDMDGLELLAEVKQAYPEKIFIITTSNPEFEKSAHQLGADAFLSKPYDVNDLFAVVQKYYNSDTASKKNKVTAFPSSSARQSDTDD